MINSLAKNYILLSFDMPNRDSVLNWVDPAAKLFIQRYWVAWALRT